MCDLPRPTLLGRLAGGLSKHMAKTVNIHEAKTHFSKLLRRIDRGEEVTIARDGKPIAHLIPVSDAQLARRPGSAKGKLTIRDDFDGPLPPDLERAFRK